MGLTNLIKRQTRRFYEEDIERIGRFKDKRCKVGFMKCVVCRVGLGCELDVFRLEYGVGDVFCVSCFGMLEEFRACDWCGVRFYVLSRARHQRFCCNGCGRAFLSDKNRKKYK